MPIAVHLDHATDPGHLELALLLAEQGIVFDSIMVDASHAEVETSFIILSNELLKQGPVHRAMRRTFPLPNHTSIVHTSWVSPLRSSLDVSKAEKLVSA